MIQTSQSTSLKFFASTELFLEPFTTDAWSTLATNFVLIGAGVRPLNREWPSAVTSLSVKGDDDAWKLTMLVVLLTIAPAQARERSYLRGITSVSYMGIVELKTAHCDIDMKARNTSIDFVANQSTKLKFLQEVRFCGPGASRSDKLKPSDQSNAPAMEALRKFASMPVLWLDLATIDMNGECAGNLVAEVKANRKPSDARGLRYAGNHKFCEELMLLS